MKYGAFARRLMGGNWSLHGRLDEQSRRGNEHLHGVRYPWSLLDDLTRNQDLGLSIYTAFYTH